MEEKLICPLCGREVYKSVDDARKITCISCNNPNCLSPTTGWNSDTVTTSKWNKYARSESHE